ncbi:MAG: hybrid sensor histidine kinase/response regulator [Candidatus Cloacimonetes bacterium]|nr:hybrid sensor histidine kinase/response regulator [Candidatus Cloacimonadota bacterium]
MENLKMKKPKILIVDDRKENIISIEAILQNIEAEFIRAYSGNETLKLALDNDIALILIDVQMPGMDGFETVNLMKQVQKTKHIPVIFVSAIYSDEIYKIKGVEVGGIDFITKPIIPSILEGKVNIFLDIYKQRKDLEREIELRKIAEKEVLAHKERLILMNSILRHDITNNLAVLKSAFRIFKRTKNLEIINEAEFYIAKSVNLINRMAIFGQYLDSPRELSTFDIKQILSPIIEAKSSLEFNVKGNSKVLADETINSVFDNIIRNAIIHGKTKRIDITIINKGQICEIHISDYGIGMPDEIIDKIFEEAFIYGKSGNTGIGLHIVKTAMENFGGYAYIKKHEPNGITFVLEFLVPGNK